MTGHICNFRSISALQGGLVLVAALVIAAGGVATGQEKTAATLPLERVVLFSSGVGFFEHNGHVQDDAEVQLRFDVEDVNDLLKSMVVEDLDGGQVSSVGYGSKDPITKTLKSFAVDLTTNPTLAELLGQVRGEQVELEAPNLITGIILGVEKRKQKVGDDEVIETDVLNLLSDDGLRSVSLDSVSQIRLLDITIDAELRKALALLASSHSIDKKTVTIDFRGAGRRNVRVGYIQETPVWKTSYRLVLADDKKPYLQGWAIVENTTEEDWSDVELTLISGRPISFTMDLYEPLYVPRPRVELELYASLRPQSYDQDLGRKEKEFLAKRLAEAEAAPMAADEMGLLAGRMLKSSRSSGKAEADKKSNASWELQEGVQSTAAAGEVGELFQYAIDTPVSLPRQQSAMLPIVAAEVAGEKISIYNPNVHAKHPLNGLWLTNTTDLHLMQGPITVLDGGTYAGDAKIDDLPPGSKRLVSYAMDLDVEVAPTTKGRPEQLLAVRLIKGTMIVTRKHQRAQEYTVKNSGSKPKTVLIEYPHDPTWKLIEPDKPAEETRDRYRFAVKVAPGEPEELLIEEERTDSQQVSLTNIDDGSVRLYLSAKVVGDRVKEALQEIVRRKHEIDQLLADRRELEQRISEIGKDQTRIRDNMSRLDRNSELYNRYVKKFSDQEDEIEGLRERILALTDKETGLRKSLDEFLMGLDLS